MVIGVKLVETTFSRSLLTLGDAMLSARSVLLDWPVFGQAVVLSV